MLISLICVELSRSWIDCVVITSIKRRNDQQSDRSRRSATSRTREQRGVKRRKRARGRVRRRTILI